MECPVCGNGSTSTFFNYPDFLLMDCPDCDLIFQPEGSRSKSVDLIPKIYNDDWIQMRDQWMRSSYLDHGSFNMLILQALIPNQGKLLEIGSGTGEFLNMARAAGWDALGIEPSPASCTYIAENYQLPVIEGIWSPELHLPENSFDAVVFWHVFEHVPEPIAFLKEISSLLKPECFLFFSVPNRYCLKNELFNASSPLFTEADHLYHHSEQSLRRCIEKAGLELHSLFSRQTFNELEATTSIHPVYRSLTFPQKMELLAQLQAEMRGHELFCVAKKGGD